MVFKVTFCEDTFNDVSIQNIFTYHAAGEEPCTGRLDD